MLDYRGRYRTTFEIDQDGRMCEFTFIPCRIRKGSNICRHDEYTLSAYIPGIQTVNRLLKEYPDIFKPFQIGDKEGTILFSESKMDQAARILKVRVQGKNVSPRAKRNKKFV